ncbi:MAG: hypothetical protein JWP39_46, partial [Jatrophihabitans sp.]|nr:hypothetical protein [Jatrophihabitans sp.]
MLGVSGFDSEVPDPSRAGAQANAARIASIEARLAQIDVDSLHDSDRVNHAVLGGLAWGARSDLEHGLWEANASAASYASPQAMVFQSVPTAPLRDAAAVDGYLRRLGRLGWYLDAIAERYARAKDDGRVPTAVGVVHAMEQLAGHLALSPAEDTLLSPALPADVDTDKVRSQAARIVAEEVRPAMRRLRSRLQDDLLPVARPDDRVGIRFVPGGEEGYRAAVRRHTTTGLSAEEIHQTGRDYLDALGAEWAEVGGRAFGTTDVAEIRRRLREDPTLRFTDRAGIVAMVDGALRRAEEVRDDWFPAYDLPPC